MAPALRFLSAMLLASSCHVLAAPGQQELNLRDYGLPAAKRQDTSLAGYLGAFFLGNEPSVYFYTSQDNNPNSLTALNGGDPVLVPTVGTGGVRDPTIVAGGGDEAGQKWYIIGTDLDIGKTSWDVAQRNGSRGIFVWESTDLVNWTGERLVEVEDETAGMVWAPEAIWDATQGQYLTLWSSKFYDNSDTAHTGASTNTVIRYAYTSDFKTFSAPATYIDYAPTSLIDTTILAYPDSDSTFLRFTKDETLKTVFVEYSTTGLFGTWTRPGGSGASIRSQVEGPAAFWDNVEPGLVHLLVDYYAGSGSYAPLESTDPENNSEAAWVDSDTANFPSGLRHGSVLPVTAELLGGLEAATWA